jgi:cytochrome d ubiquinol oxidase subunit II
VPAGGQAGDPVNSWINPTSIVTGVLAVAVTAYVAVVLLTWDAGRLSDETTVAYFRIRAVAAGVVAGVAALVGLFVVRNDATYLFDGLTSRALPLVVVSVLAGLGALVLLRGRRRKRRTKRASAVPTTTPLRLLGRCRICRCCGVHVSVAE